jgi:hypothetical protein
MEGAIDIVRVPRRNCAQEPAWLDGTEYDMGLYGYAMGFSATRDALSSREKTIRFVRKMCRKFGTASLEMHDLHLNDVEMVFATVGVPCPDYVEKLPARSPYINTWNDHYSSEATYPQRATSIVFSFPEPCDAGGL